MAGIASVVLQLPYLNQAPVRFGQHAVLNVCECDTVNAPLAPPAIELEVLVYAALALRPRHGAQRRRQLGRIASTGTSTVASAVTHDEPHHLVGVGIFVLVREDEFVPHRHILSLEAGEVDDYLVPLAHGDQQVGSFDGPRQQTRVGGDDVEVEGTVTVTAALEPQEEGARDGDVEEAKPVATWLDAEVGPGLAVYLDDVAIQAVIFVGWRVKATIVVVLLRSASVNVFMGSLLGG